jgi:DNA helicase-2/ATP-dependent DNA helicase PcrA
MTYLTSLTPAPAAPAADTALSPEQADAVHYGEGPLLILAGAGSGKTRVLTQRIAHLISSGACTADEVMAVTFTNKAARELKDRLGGALEGEVSRMWVGTFHGICLKLLRMHGNLYGEKNFSVLDASQTRQTIGRIADSLNVDRDLYKPQMLASRISRLKNDLITADQFVESAQTFGPEAKVAQVYPAYEQYKRSQKVCDFDDLLSHTHGRLTADPVLAADLGQRFKYLFVDEFQDTNGAQFSILKILSAIHGNLCVVGDDDQSIYAFRGANVGNILAFTDIYPTAKKVTLGRNYRSTGHILAAAGAVIAENKARYAKQLVTDNPDGELPVHHTAADETAEVRFVSATLRKEQAKGRKWGQMAVLYRTNGQARVLEEGLSADRIPYRVIGGMRFYQRKEVRDLLGYLRLAVSPHDDDAALRVLNSPPRGIGNANRTRITEFAAAHAISIPEALEQMAQGGHLKGVALRGVQSLLTVLGKLQAAGPNAAEVLKQALELTRYDVQRDAEPSHEARARREVVAELIGAAESHGGDAVSFLDDQALAGAGDEDESEDQVALMTLHAAKGLEFPVVFMVGMEEGVFPHSFANDSEQAMGEERRLCYVGMTRAMERLFMVSASRRKLYGENRANLMSRFVGAIAPENIQFSADRTQPEPYQLKGFTRRQAADPRNAAARKAAIAGTATLRVRATDATPVSGQSALVPAADAASYSSGDRVRHAKFGLGQVRNTEGSGEGERVVVAFPGVGTKKLSVKLAKLEVIH